MSPGDPPVCFPSIETRNACHGTCIFLMEVLGIKLGSLWLKGKPLLTKPSHRSTQEPSITIYQVVASLVDWGEANKHSALMTRITLSSPCVRRGSGQGSSFVSWYCPELRCQSLGISSGSLWRLLPAFSRHAVVIASYSWCCNHPFSSPDYGKRRERHPKQSM